MSFTFTSVWNATYEAIPADNENINLGAGRIRDLKLAIHQRLAIDHSWSGDANDGKHNQVTLRTTPATPLALDPTDSALGAVTIAGNSELFYQDSSQRLIQLTNQGSIFVAPAFPSGTQMVFVQAAAPVGWTQNTAVNDTVLRMVNNNTGGSGGGSWAISGLNASTSVAGHQLSSDELPSHTHQVNAVTSVGGNIGFAGGTTYNLGQFSISTDGGAVNNQAHSHGASTSVFGDGTWRPAYTNAMFAIKN